MAPNDGLTAFERRRAENAKANNALLHSISQTSAKVFGAAKPAKTSSSPHAAAKKRPPRRAPSGADAAAADVPVPRLTRRSARVAGLDAEGNAGGDANGNGSGSGSGNGSDALKYGLGESAEAAARAKRLRVSGDLDLHAMQVDGRWQGSLQGLSGLGARPGVRTFTDADGEASDKDVQRLRQALGKLRLYDKFAVKDLKLTKERIYALTFHPTEDKPLVIAGDKEGRLGLFDAAQEPAVTAKEEDAADDDDAADADADAPAPVIIGFKPHARTISSVYVLDSDPNAVYTASYDATIRKLDLAAQKSVEVYAPAPDEETDADAAISCIDFAADNPHVVYLSTLRGALGRHDVRTPPTAARDVWPALHDGHKIGGFSLSPRQPHLVATASLDRTVKIWDLRKIERAAPSGDDGGGDDDGDGDGDGLPRPWLVGADPARLSVSHAAWGPGGHLATTSYDDTIRVYDLAAATAAAAAPPGFTLAADALAPAHRIHHNNQTGRWVTILKPQWQRHLPPGGPAVHKFVVGNMNRFVDVFAANGEQLAQLDGDGITAVPAVAQLHPSRDWVAGGNASGKLTLWM